MKKILILALLTGCLTSYGQTLDSLNDEGLIKYVTPSFTTNDPLFIISIDNKTIEVKQSEIFGNAPGINPNWILSVNIYRGQNALDKYGERAQYGAVLIELEKESADKLPLELKKKFADSKN